MEIEKYFPAIMMTTSCLTTIFLIVWNTRLNKRVRLLERDLGLAKKSEFQVKENTRLLSECALILESECTRQVELIKVGPEVYPEMLEDVIRLLRLNCRPNVAFERRLFIDGGKFPEFENEIEFLSCEVDEQMFILNLHDKSSENNEYEVFQIGIFLLFQPQ